MYLLGLGLCFRTTDEGVIHRRVKIIKKCPQREKKTIQPGLTPTFAQVTEINIFKIR